MKLKNDNIIKAMITKEVTCGQLKLKCYQQDSKNGMKFCFCKAIKIKK